MGACREKLVVASCDQAAERLTGTILSWHRVSPEYWEHPAHWERRARPGRFRFFFGHLQSLSLLGPAGPTRFATTDTLILMAFLVMSTTLFLQKTCGQSLLTELESVGPETRTAVRQPWWRFKPWPNSKEMPDRATVSPHPSVVRIVAPEGNATSYGTGTLVDVRARYGLVVTNWHVVCEATGPVEVCFPDGFRSQARTLKLDPDWDLAALVVWRPAATPVSIADQPPRPGDALTIHGYGRGQYRVAHGRCTQYYAPSPDCPEEMVELTVEARQGDSGGPILNDRGELAGVLFGAGQGTTIGSFSRRVELFLATLAPDIGQSDSGTLLADSGRDAPNVILSNRSTTAFNATHIESPTQEKPAVAGSNQNWDARDLDNPNLGSTWPDSSETTTVAALSPWRQPTTGSTGRAIANPVSEQSSQTVAPKTARIRLLDQLQSFLAIIGLFAICILIVRAVG
jgi:hypothetical protein